MVLELHHKYGVPDVVGFRYGFEGLNPAGVAPVSLTPAVVEDIHKHGGSVLGLSRGKQDIGVMVDTLVARGVSLLFCIGGDGTLRAAHAISDECLRRGLAIAVVGVPKTVDNDLSATDFTFGFDTAVQTAVDAIDRLHTTAESHDRVRAVEEHGEDNRGGRSGEEEVCSQ
jgi:6-phosphofructokinase 1